MQFVVSLHHIATSATCSASYKNAVFKRVIFNSVADVAKLLTSQREHKNARGKGGVKT